MATEVAKASVTLLLFIELDFSSGFLRVTTAGYDVAWNGFNWTGVGMLGTVEAIAEDTSLQANGIKLGLSGVDAAIIAIALQEDYQGRAAKIWCGAVGTNGAIVADPILIFVGRMDNMSLTDGQQAAVMLQLENELASWDRPRIRRFTDADQKSEYPTDRGFEFITESATRTISWGKG